MSTTAQTVETVYDATSLKRQSSGTVLLKEASPLDGLSRATPFPTWMREYLDTSDCTYVELKEGDKFFPLVSRYLVKSSEAQSFTIGTKQAMIPWYWESQDKKKKEKTTQLDLGAGVHRAQWKGHSLLILVQDVGAPVGCSYACTRYRSMVVFMEGKQSRDALHSFLETLKNEDEKPAEKVVKIYRWSVCAEKWKKVGAKSARPISSVVLPAETKDKITADIEQFLAADTGKFYHQHGIPYKRSYLFSGPPGAGKTSLINALAGQYERSICLVQAAHPKMTDEMFSTLIQTCPKDSVLCLEDVDALFGDNRAGKDAAKGHLTFSGILNALDGIASPDAQIFVMTTNHPERLDAALIRPGRVDQHVVFEKAVEQQISAMFLNFYPDEDSLSREFAQGVIKGYEGISMAALQQHFIRHMRSSAQECLEGLDGLKDYVEDDEKRMREKVEAADGCCVKKSTKKTTKTTTTKPEVGATAEMSLKKICCAAAVLGLGLYRLGRSSAKC